MHFSDFPVLIVQVAMHISIPFYFCNKLLTTHTDRILKAEIKCVYVYAI